jgi:hypothetical protein
MRGGSLELRSDGLEDGLLANAESLELRGDVLFGGYDSRLEALGGFTVFLCRCEGLACCVA